MKIEAISGRKNRDLRLIKIILFAFFLHTSLLWSQTGNISFSIRNVNLKELLELIESKSDVMFSYKDITLDSRKDITLTAENETVEAILNKVLPSKGLGYTKTANTFAIKPKTSSPAMSAQDKQITGTITDAQGEPIIGANVVEKGTMNGVVTNIDGEFSISVQNNATLQISYIGYISQEVSTRNQTSLTITLSEDTKTLEEVVVVGYGIQKKVNLTGAVTTVATERLENRPLSSVAEGLQGTMAGVTVTNPKGEVGSNASMRIRGFSSLNSGGALVIVDGVPGNMNNISPNDIASISVLKDAASSSIYGARAAEGVVLVTTKQGTTSDKIRIQYSNNFSFNTPTLLPHPNSSYDGAVYANLAFANAGGSPLYPEWMMEKFKDPSVTAIAQSNMSDYDYVADFNWWDYFLKNSFQQTQNLSLSGGSERNKFMVSASWLDQNGYFSKWGPDNFDRVTFRVNLNNQIIPKKLILDTNISLVNSDKKLAAAGTDYIMSTIRQAGNSLPLYNPDGTYARYRMQQNTMQHLKEAGFDKSKANRFEGRIALTWNVIDGLSLKALGGYNVQWNKQTIWQRAYYKYRPSGPSNLGYVNQPNKLTESNSYYNYYIAQFQANYNKTFGKHTLGVLVGGSIEESFQNSNSSFRNNLLGNELPAMGLGEASTTQNSSSISDDWGLISGFARVNYNYAERYLLEANLRVDGSSRFSDKHKWGVFPSVSLGWRITEEAFMQNQRVFSNLKLRASYGELGNQNGLGLYDHIPVYRVVSQLIPFPNGNLQQIYAPSLPSEDRTWETVTSYNLGLEMGFLNDRLRIEGEVYNKRNKDMLISIDLPSIIGITVPTGNYGELSTKGWEISLRWQDEIKSAGLKYHVDFNLYDQTDELVDLQTPFAKPTAGVQNLQGYPINSIFAYEADGYFQSDEEVAGWAFQNANTKMGDIRYIDHSEDDKITVDDVIYAGSTTPRFCFGLNMGASWNNFDLSLFFQGVGKRKVYLSTDYSHPYQNTWDNYSFKEVMDYWTPENRDARFPRPHQGNHNYLYSTHWLQDASYIRLKNLQIGYSIPKQILSKAKMESLRLYVSGENLWESTSMIMLDPESGGTGVYPINRSFSLGLSLTF